LGVTPGTGSYQRKTPEGKGADYVYNRIVEPKMLLWLIEASGVDPELLTAARSAVDSAHTLPGQAKAIRQRVPYRMVADALWNGRGSRSAEAMAR